MRRRAACTSRSRRCRRHPRSYEIHNSPLSENATVGFEFGYNVQAPATLVLWEAQYGDFINGAQAIIDEFLTSARAKWGLTPSLVLLLPHGYEGQGPEHSSARVERFLEAAADINLRIANCTTSAQYFHLLRRQAALLLPDPLPLVVLTPKSLLRHPMVASRPLDLSEGRWQPVLTDPEALARAREVRRVILCSGKVYVDLISSEFRAQHPEVAICRMEQLYPFPWADLHPVLDGFPNREEIVWVQEEPENMGAWEFVRPLLEDVDRWRLPSALRRACPEREPVRRLDDLAHEEPADAHRRSVRPHERTHANKHGPIEAGVVTASRPASASQST